MKENAQKIVPLHFRNSSKNSKNFIKNESNWIDVLTMKDITNYINICYSSLTRNKSNLLRIDYILFYFIT